MAPATAILISGYRGTNSPDGMSTLLSAVLVESYSNICLNFMATTAEMRLRMLAPQAPTIKRVPPTRCAVPLHTNISAAHPLTNKIQTVIVARALNICGILIEPPFLIQTKKGTINHRII